MVSIQPNAIVDHLCVIRDEAELKALVPDEIGRFGPCHHLLPIQRCWVPLVRLQGGAQVARAGSSVHSNRMLLCWAFSHICQLLCCTFTHAHLCIACAAFRREPSRGTERDPAHPDHGKLNALPPSRGGLRMYLCRWSMSLPVAEPHAAAAAARLATCDARCCAPPP